MHRDLYHMPRMTAGVGGSLIDRGRKRLHKGIQQLGYLDRVMDKVVQFKNSGLNNPTRLNEIINMLYACVGICTKKAALQSPMSWWYWLWFAGAVAVIGIYAMLWQQVLKRIELGTAYMFKGTSLIFTMLIAALLFGEAITVPNIIGSVIIIVGIVFLARS